MRRGPGSKTNLYENAGPAQSIRHGTGIDGSCRKIGIPKDRGGDMATFQVMCWQEIPSVVEAREAGVVHKVALGRRFQELIDLAAMKRGLAGSDAYLEQWTKSPRQEREGTAAEVADSVAAELEARFDQLREEVLAKSRKTPAG
jgi:hypothetical protein